MMNIRLLRLIFLAAGFHLISGSVNPMKRTIKHDDITSHKKLKSEDDPVSAVGPLGLTQVDHGFAYPAASLMVRMEIQMYFFTKQIIQKEDHLSFVGSQRSIKLLSSASEDEKRAGCCYSYVNLFLQKTYPDLFEKIIITLKEKGILLDTDKVEHGLGEIGFDLIHKFIDEFMVPTHDPKPQDLVLYYNFKQSRANYNHVGIMHSDGMVLSKWGWQVKGICIHEVCTTPYDYGPYVKFYTMKIEEKPECEKFESEKLERNETCN